jgi:methionyl-tRNA formyltransferase
LRILAIGRNEILFRAVEKLVRDGAHEVVAIVTSKAMPEYQKTETDFLSFAEKFNIPFIFAQKIDAEVLRLIEKQKPDIGISFNWVSVIKDDLLSLLSSGKILNAHFGDLPRYRGNAVTNWALIKGENEIVLTVHEMEPGGLDSGDIWLQRPFGLGENTTIRQINEFAEENVPSMFLEAIQAIESGQSSKTQTATGLTPFRCYPRLPRDGRIDWSAGAKQIHALVRALTKPYSGAFTYYRTPSGNLEQLFIWKTAVVESENRDVSAPGHVIQNDSSSGRSLVYCGDGGVLAIQSASHGANGSEFQPGDVWKTIRMRLGMDVEQEIFNLLRAQEVKNPLNFK